MDGLVVGSQIQCISPAAKEVPQIITENGGYPTAPLLPPFLTPRPCVSPSPFSQSRARGSLRTGCAKHRERVGRCAGTCCWSCAAALCNGSCLNVSVYVCTRVQVLSCNTSKCIKMLLRVILCVFRLPPSGSCIHLAKARDGCGIFVHLLPRLVLYNPGNEAVPALNASHPMQQPQSPAGMNDPACNFILLLPDLDLYAEFLAPSPAFTAFSCSRFATGSLSQSGPGQKNTLSPRMVPPPTTPCPFLFPFLTAFLGTFKSTCGSLQGLTVKALTLLVTPRDAERVLPFPSLASCEMYCKVCL